MMKAEKIKKHMLRRTVVVAKNGYHSDWDVLGVMGGKSTVSVIVYGLANGKRDHWMHEPANIRKATDDERAEFFAWLVSDGRDIADGFQRFGGMPRGFEAWRAAQTPAAEPAPACAVGWMFTKPNPDVPEPVAPPFTIGQRVRIACSTSAYAGRVGEIVATRGEPTQYGVALRDGLPSWYVADWLEPVADEPTPEPVVTSQHKVGDLRIWLRSNGIGAVARITASKDGVVAFAEYKAYDADAVFEPTRANMARLVGQQRGRGIMPEESDLVYAMGCKSGGMRGCVAFVVRVGDAMALARAADVPLMSADNLHVLVIRRNPLREVADE